MSLDIFGDRWSLLIVRDMMVRGYRSFTEFERSGEGIATNILADRLRKLEASGILTTELDTTDARKLNYRLTRKGIDLAPVLLDLLIWGAHHEDTGAPCAVIDRMEQNRGAVLTEVQRRWHERDPEPFLPPFPGDRAAAPVRPRRPQRHRSTRKQYPLIQQSEVQSGGR